MPALAAPLFHQAQPADRHTPVYGFAHVVNGEQRDAARGEGFHFYAGLASAFGGGFAQHAVGRCVHFKFHRHACERQRVAQGDEVAGFFGALYAGNAGNAQHVALFGVAALNECERGGLHADVALGHRHAVGAGFGGHVHHVGLSLGVEVGERAGGLGGGGGCFVHGGGFARALQKPCGVGGIIRGCVFP